LNLLKKIPLFIFLLPVFFCLHGVTENSGYISFNEVIKTFANIFISVFTLFGLLYALTRSLSYAGIVSFFISVFYLFFGVIQDNVKPIPFLHSYSVLLPLLFLTLIAVIIFFRKKHALQSKWVLYLNLLLPIYCIFDGFSLILKSSEKNTDYSALFLNVAAVKEKPDVYFLLFDEYPGYKSLKDSFGFKNDSLYNKLSIDSFVFMPVFSNYSMTAYSMSSIFNMQYILDTKDKNINEQKLMQKRYKEIKTSLVFSGFYKMGYSISAFSIFDVQNQQSMGGNSFILSHSRLLTDKILHNRLIKDIGWVFATGKYSIPFLQKFYLGDVENYNNNVESGVNEILHKKKDSVPKFVYAHFLIPHQPYFFDSIGRRNPLANLEDDSILRNKVLFLSYLKYCNKKISSLADNIIKANSNALIILMSDHGFRYYSNNGQYEPYNFDNFCAIRYLQKKPVALFENFSNVNIFRYIFKEYFNQKISYLKDRVDTLGKIPTNSNQ
jgi:hypothetical protein